MNDLATMQPPTPRRYTLATIAALLILIPLWTIFVMVVVQPESLMKQEQTMGSRLLWWVAVPMVAVGLLSGARWMMASKTAQAREQHRQVNTQQIVATDQSRREYVLEVIGLGATLDKYRQGALWTALQNGNPYT